MRDVPRKLIDEITRQLVREGRIVEGGWKGFCLTVMPPKAGEQQIHDMRVAFFAGAQHLWASIMTVLEPGAEPTSEDLHRMTLINQELERFVQELTEERRTRR